MPVVVSGKVINLCPESRKDTAIGLVMKVKLHKRVRKRTEEQILRRYRLQMTETTIGVAYERAELEPNMAETINLCFVFFDGGQSHSLVLSFDVVSLT